MRKITEQAVNAFLNNETFNKSNMTVTSERNENKMYLHGNLIAKANEKGDIYISNAGWFSNTTKERLNGLGQRLGFSIYQKNWEWYLDGDNWDGDWIKVYGI